MAEKKENIPDLTINDGTNTVNIDVGIGDIGESMAIGTFEIKENTTDIGIAVKDES